MQAETLTVHWVKSTVNTWLPLETVDLREVDTLGVYVIWHEGSQHQAPRVVRVGQGDICDRLSRHRNDDAILRYKQFGTLRVTWAAVSEQYLDGVERFLANHYRPQVGDAFPDVRPAPVNLP